MIRDEAIEYLDHLAEFVCRKFKHFIKATNHESRSSPRSRAGRFRLNSTIYDHEIIL